MAGRDYPRVGVYGAGAIGAYLGIRLSAIGVPVTLVGRPWLVDLQREMQARGIDGTTVKPGSDLVVTTDAASLREVDLVLVSVKSRHSAQAGEALAELIEHDTPVLSLQNGLRNPERLRAAGLDEVVPGMVGFNVFLDDTTATFRQATSGPLSLGLPSRATGVRAIKRLGEAVVEAGEQFEMPPDIGALQRGKLLLNLNNGVCAVAGVSIAESVRDRELRRAFAKLIREGLGVFEAAGAKVSTVGKLPPKLLTRLLPLPNGLVLRVAPALVSIDERARSSTLQDLEAGKPTEIDDLSGEIVRRGAELGLPTPYNAWIVEQVRALEAQHPQLKHPAPTAFFS